MKENEKVPSFVFIQNMKVLFRTKRRSLEKKREMIHRFMIMPFVLQRRETFPMLHFFL